MFNRYEFLESVKNEITEQKPNDLYEFIHEQIENEVIYYNDCFEICKNLMFTDFTNHEFGAINNISQAAFCALWDFIQDNWTEIEECCNFEEETENEQN
jgi:hypothetical protein